ncbi:hypothetical protein ACFL56_00360 [Candidatus Margulisiibacteriota bacterium]
MLYFVFTVDGDWRDYFWISKPTTQRRPKKKYMLELFDRQFSTLNRNLDMKFIHFIHTSPFARSFFYKEPFLTLWQEITHLGADVGIHCHEEIPYRKYYFNDTRRMNRVISQHVKLLRKNDIPVSAYRGGFLAFSSDFIPILKRNKLFFDFSCKPDHYFIHNNKIISDWCGSPRSHYQMSLNDYKKTGRSGIYEIPIGSYKNKFLHFDSAIYNNLRTIGFYLSKQSQKKDSIVSVVSHSYDFATKKNCHDIEKKITLLKNFGSFVNLEEAITHI